MSKQDAKAAYDLNRSATHLLHRAQQAAVTLSASALATSGLTIRQFAVLAALHSENGQGQSSLVEATGIDRSTLADMVARMEKSNLIKRVTSKEDARAKAVFLSAAGEKAYKNAASHVDSADAALLKNLGNSKRVALIAALSSLAGATEPKPPKTKKKSKKAGKAEKKNAKKPKKKKT